MGAISGLPKEKQDFIGYIDRATSLVSIDTETTGLSVRNGKDHIQGLSATYKVGGLKFEEYFPVFHCDKENNLPVHTFHEVVRVLGTKPNVFFNRIFDLHSIASSGIEFHTDTTSYDLSVLGILLDERRPYAKKLENYAKMYTPKLGKVGAEALHKYANAMGWDTVPVKLMAPYAMGDSTLTLEVAEEVLRRLKKSMGNDFDNLWGWEQAFSDSLYRMERRGINVDLKFCRQFSAISQISMDEIVEELGFTPSKTSELSKFLFEELKLPVLEKSEKTGKPTMNKAVMEEYERMLSQEVETDHRAKTVLDFRGWQKAKSSFYDPFQKLADKEGKIHASFNQAVTVTGRLSCSDPNLQQIPRSSDKEWNGRIRTAFHAPEGFSLLGFDYSQLEFRLGAAYGQVEWLIKEFGNEDADVFTTLSNIISTDRFTAKTYTYAMIYGAQERKIAATLKRTVPEIHDSYVSFQESIDGIVKIKAKIERVARQRGYVRYWTGRRRRADRHEVYKMFNSMLQGGGAEVVKRVLVLIDNNVCDENCMILLQVHDEIVFAVRKGMEEEYSAKIVKVMEEYPTKIFEVQFKVEGKAWG